MTDTLWLLAGPAFALLALLLFTIPCVRPRAFAHGIGWLAAWMVFPTVIGYALQSYELISVAFVFKPIAAMASAALFLGYLVMWRSKRLPLITSLPSVALLFGSIADVLAVYQLGNEWGGASC